MWERENENFEFVDWQFRLEIPSKFSKIFENIKRAIGYLISYFMIQKQIVASMNIPGSALCPHLVSTAHQRSTDWATVKARVGGSPNRFKPVKGQIKINFGVEKPFKGLTILHLMQTKSKSKWMSRFQSIYPTGNQSKMKTCSIFASKYRKIPPMIYYMNDHVQHGTVQCHLSSPKATWFDRSNKKVMTHDLSK